MQALGSIVPALTAFLAFSEYGALDGRRLNGVPVGWQITGYPGVADGRNELRGYFEGRRAAR